MFSISNDFNFTFQVNNVANVANKILGIIKNTFKKFFNET